MATWWASIVVAACIVSVTLGDIAVGPQNVAALVGSDITLTCTSTTTGNERVQFVEFVTNPTGAYISDGGFLLPGHPNYFRYGFSTDMTNGVYNLTIRGLIIDDGGEYGCQDSNLAGSYALNDVIAIDGLPNCSTTLPPNRIVNVGAYYSAECLVNFRARDGIAPIVTWTGYGNYNQATIGHNTSTWGGVSFNVELAMDGRAFQGKTNFTDNGFGVPDPNSATNVPVWQYLYSTGLLFVQYGPTNMRYAPIQASYEVGQVLTCYADSQPLPSYTWSDMIALIDYPSQSLTLSIDMVGYRVLRCRAVNSVSTGNLFVNITVNPITTPTIPPTTTPVPTVPAVGYCDDLTGRWEANHGDGTWTILCINVDASQNGLVQGLWVNSTDDPYFTEIVGRTRNDEYDQIGFSTMWADRIGVSSFAGECHKCLGIEYLMVNAVSRSSSDQAFCADGGSIYISQQLDFYRVTPVTYPCSTNPSTMAENARKSQEKLPLLRRRRRSAAPRV